MRLRRVAAGAAVTAALLLVAPQAASALGTADSGASARTFANCTQLNKTYPHGVGKKGARDKVSGSTKPVTNFKVDNALYAANKKSDRDGDGVACEKR